MGKRGFLTILLIVLMVSLVSCTPKNKPIDNDKVLESGFVYSFGEPLPSDFCAYRIEKNEFSIDRDYINFYFGGLFNSNIELELSSGKNFPEFSVYFVDKNETLIQTAINFNENYVSDKFRVSCINNEKKELVNVNYNFSTQLIIPSEVVNEDYGQIRIRVGGININETDPTFQIISAVNLNYKKEGTNIVLTKI